MKCSISWDVRVTIVRCSGLERSRRGKIFYCNIRTPVHRIAIPKVMWLLYPKFWVQTFDIATLRTGVSVFCNLHTAFPLNFPVCVPRPRSGFYWHRSRFSSWSPDCQCSCESKCFSFKFLYWFHQQVWNSRMHGLDVQQHAIRHILSFRSRRDLTESLQEEDGRDD